MKSAQEAAPTSERDEKKRLQAVRSREKKKKHVEKLEEEGKRMTTEVEDCELELSRCKDQLFQAIQTSKQVLFGVVSIPTNMFTLLASSRRT